MVALDLPTRWKLAAMGVGMDEQKEKLQKDTLGIKVLCNKCSLRIPTCSEIRTLD